MINASEARHWLIYNSWYLQRGQKMSEDITTNVVNEVALTIIDADHALHDTMPTGMADVVLAALTAEPETLEELEAAIGRYDKPIVKRGFLKHLKTGVTETASYAGPNTINLPPHSTLPPTPPPLY